MHKELLSVALVLSTVNVFSASHDRHDKSDKLYETARLFQEMLYMKDLGTIQMIADRQGMLAQRELEIARRKQEIEALHSKLLNPWQQRNEKERDLLRLAQLKRHEELSDYALESPYTHSQSMLYIPLPGQQCRLQQPMTCNNNPFGPSIDEIERINNARISALREMRLRTPMQNSELSKRYKYAKYLREKLHLRP